jgi:hypothetical protein
MLYRYSSSRVDLHKQAVPKEDELIDNCQVAVVGYGPTGMTLAALLGRLGHRVIVLERYIGLYNLPRPACFDDEIMRVFQKLGIAEEIGRGARPQYEYDWVNGAGKTLVKLEYEKTAPGRLEAPCHSCRAQPRCEVENIIKSAAQPLCSACSRIGQMRIGCRGVRRTTKAPPWRCSRRGRISGRPWRPKLTDGTAPMAPECQSFLDNVVAQRHLIAEFPRWITRERPVR